MHAIASSPVDILDWLRVTNRSDVLTPAERTVATEIGTRIGSRSGTCYPSLQTIADSIGLCLSLVKRAVRKLVEMGLLAVRYTGRQNVYSLRGVPGWLSDGHARRPKGTKVSDEVLPQPPEGELRAEPKPLNKPETAHEPEATSTPTTEPLTPEIDAQDVVQALIAHFFLTTGTRCDTARHRKAIVRALKTHTAEQIKRAASHCASTWSNTAWATPAAVCKRGRIDEVLSQAKASAAPRAAAHKLFERTPEPPRAAPATVAAGLSALRAALGRGAAAQPEVCG